MSAISDKIFTPAVRFSEFSGNWELVRFSKCFKGIKKIPKKSDNYPLYSLTIKDGVTPKTERYEREFLVKSVDTAYKIVERDNFVYNPMNLRFGALAKHNSSYPVVVSKYYDVFSCKHGFLANYFANYLLTNRMIIFYNRMATGTLEEKKRLHFSDFLNFEKPIPSEEEQLKIANFLTSVDTKIQQLKRKHTLMKQYKKGVMQQLFSQQLRFKDEEGQDYPRWEKKTLGQVASFSKGKGISKSELIANGEQACILYGELYTRYGEVIENAVSSTSNNDAHVLSKEGDVIIPASGESALDIATVACVKKMDIALGGDLNIIRSNLDGTFLAYYLNNHKCVEIARLAQGSSVTHIYSNHLKLLKIEVPSKTEQQNIASFLTEIDEKIKHINTQITQAETFKKGLLQQMFV